MTKKSYDLIGDIHGRFDKLAPLLKSLGYRHNGTSLAHPNPNRTAIFLGDLIDPKDDTVPNGTREVLHTVRDMVEAGAARCILGNHEYNFVAYRTRNTDGHPIRPHIAKNHKMHAGTEAAFTAHPDELENIFLPWIKTLPFHLDLPELRAVHACWHPASLDLLKDKTLADLDFLSKSGIKGTHEYHAVEIALKGIEIALPEGEVFHDHTGTPRRHIRARWWDKDATGATIRNVVFPPKDDLPDTPIDPSEIAKLPGYRLAEKPLFFGHYYKTFTPRHPILAFEHEAPNLICLDFSAATNGPLTSYHWTTGERHLFPENLHLADPANPLGLITAFLSAMPATDGYANNAWTSLTAAAGDLPFLYEETYGPWAALVLADIDVSDLADLWLSNTDEGSDFEWEFSNKHPNRELTPNDFPPPKTMALDLTDHFLGHLRAHAEDIHSLRENINLHLEALAEEALEEEEPNDGPWTLGFVENRNTTDLDAPIIPMSGHLYQTYEEAKLAADTRNQEAREEEGMFADLIVVRRMPL
ncbi:MAG: metallophosphoesterase [Verrucomicrobiaceae bacterium]